MLIITSSQGTIYECVHGVKDTALDLHRRSCVDCRYESTLQSERYFRDRAERAVDEAWERFK